MIQKGEKPFGGNCQISSEKKTARISEKYVFIITS